MRPVSRIALALAAATAVLATAACGSSFTPGPATKRREARPLSSIYDFTVTIPDLSFPQFLATGLTIDMTLEIEPEGIDPSGSFDGAIVVHEARAGGVPRPFTADVPLAAKGVTDGIDWAIDSFGPIRIGTDAIGTTHVMLSLDGMIAVDGRTIAGIAVVTSSGEIGDFLAIRQRRYLVAATSFGVTGTVSLVRVRRDTHFEIERDLEAVSGDPVVRASGSGVYVINRFFFDNVQSLDPSAGFATAIQFSTGNGSNPHDVVQVDPGRLYVARYEPPYNDLLIANPRDGSTLGFIDLSALATNSTGTPRADSLVEARGHLFAGLQNIDISFAEYRPGIVAVIDPNGGSLVRSITMQGTNPFGPPAVHPVTGDLHYAMAGIFQGGLGQELSGGIEVIDPDTLTTRGLLVDDDDLGGNVSGVAIAAVGGGVIGYCVVTDASGVNRVRAFDPDTGEVLPGVVFASSSFLPELTSDGDGYILVPVHDPGDPRLLVLDAASGSVLATLRFSLPPFSVTVLTRELPPR